MFALWSYFANVFNLCLPVFHLWSEQWKTQNQGDGEIRRTFVQVQVKWQRWSFKRVRLSFRQRRLHAWKEKLFTISKHVLSPCFNFFLLNSFATFNFLSFHSNLVANHRIGTLSLMKRSPFFLCMLGLRVDDCITEKKPKRYRTKKSTKSKSASTKCNTCNHEGAKNKKVGSRSSAKKAFTPQTAVWLLAIHHKKSI